MIVWSGWGILVLLFGLIGFAGGIAAGEAIGPAFHLADTVAKPLGIGIGGLAASAMIYFCAKWIEAGESHVYVDESTGQRIHVRRSAGSLFFIPMRWWTWIALPITAFVAYSMTQPLPPP